MSRLMMAGTATNSYATNQRARRWIYWSVTGLMCAFMLSSAVPDLLRIPQAVAIMRHLGYPPYLLVFLGTAKTLGVAAVLVTGQSRLKEWAFAGLAIDLTGALYSHLSVGDSLNGWLPAAIGLALVSSAYLVYRTQSGTRTITTPNTEPAELAEFSR